MTTLPDTKTISGPSVVIESSDWLGSDPLCMYCANREGCMPYNDEDLAFGADSGHVSTVKEGCTTFRKIYKNETN